MSGIRRRETIHISLGETSNAVTSHLLNLEGLSVISSSASSAPAVCDPLVTHTIDSQDQVWVPRVLFVDESHRIQKGAAASSANRQQALPTAANAAATNTSSTNPTAAAASVWSGNIQQVSMDTLNQFSNFTNVDDVVANTFFNNDTLQPNNNHGDAPWLSSWQQTANQLAYGPYSQYRVSQEEMNQKSLLYSYNNNTHKEEDEEPSSRHVDWDNLGEEPDEDPEEMAALQERNRLRQLQQWDAERQQLEDQLSSIWTSEPSPATASSRNKQLIEQQDQDSPTSSSRPFSAVQESDLQHLSWMDYWMPPYPAPLTQYTYGLPSTSAVSSFQSPALHSYVIDSNQTTMLEELWEKLRIQLERTDSCQGFTVITEGSGLYAGMTHWLMQELQQECRAAGRWVFQISKSDDDEDSSADDTRDVSTAEEDGVDRENTPPSSRTNELSRAQAVVRGRVQRGLALSGLSDTANVLIPLILPSTPSGGKKSLFRASAELAMALEAAMLPHRCQASERTLVGWNSMSGYEEGTTPRGMSLGDYLLTLQPSPRYSLLELDSVKMTGSNRQRLAQVLAGGTSVERDPRMRLSSQSAGMSSEYPGSWLMDAEYQSARGASPASGILSSLSPGHVAQQDRALHHHYGLSSCLRRGVFTQDSILTTNQQHLTCLMEGMGIRYRPETAFGLVTNQSLSQMTNRGYASGAGSYWHYLLSDPSNVGHGIVDIPVLSVLGNTTRMYPYLHSTASEMKDALKSSKNKGLYQREVSNGTLPEVEDCDEALEYCWDLRDVYEPPHGSGLADGDEEEYFDF